MSSRTNFSILCALLALAAGPGAAQQLQLPPEPELQSSEQHGAGFGDRQTT